MCICNFSEEDPPTIASTQNISINVVLFGALAKGFSQVVNQEVGSTEMILSFQKLKTRTSDCFFRSKVCQHWSGLNRGTMCHILLCWSLDYDDDEGCVAAEYNLQFELFSVSFSLLCFTRALTHTDRVHTLLRLPDSIENQLCHKGLMSYLKTERGIHFCWSWLNDVLTKTPHSRPPVFLDKCAIM